MIELERRLLSMEQGGESGGLPHERPPHH
jgi:hypothetical protein